MDESDFYKILNVNKNATSEEIRSSYKKLVLKYHPDKNHDLSAPEMFRKIQIAYETLSDSNKRMKYDTFDGMDNGVKLKDVFMYYHELVIEVCQKYEFTETDREDILNLFNVDDFKDELARDDLVGAYKKLSERVWSYAPQFIIKKISEKHSYIGSALYFISKWLI